MFTGIVEELGAVRSVTAMATGARLVIDASRVVEGARVGDSIALNGCCLTVVALDGGGWAADAVGETLARTNLGRLRAGDPVNLERPLRLGDRLGGHLVQGHVDATGTVRARGPQPDGSVRLRVDAPTGVLRHVVPKGSVAVDGVSLTVADLHDDGFTVALIPHTLACTTLGVRAPGDVVNLEADVVGKYVERLLEPSRTGEA